MKKISIYFLLMCAGLMAASCVDPITPQNRIGDGSFGINLSVVCSSPDTKATRPGDDDGAYNENKVNWIDWFVFKNGETVPVEHGRATGTDGVMGDVVVSMDQHVGTATSISGDVLVIANLPSDKFQHNDELGIQQKVGDSWSTEGALTRDALVALQVVASFDSGGSFNAQSSFVMTGETTYSLTTAAPAQEVTATLTRLAVKFTLDLSVVPAIDEVQILPNGQAVYTQTWYPLLDQIDIYMSYADNHTTIDGTTLKGVPEQYAAANFFTYNREGFIPKFSYTGDTYKPQTVFPPLDSSATNPYPAVVPEWDNDEFAWKVTGSPFYTYPIEWKTSDATAPFIKIILPWKPYAEQPIYKDGVFTRATRTKGTPVTGVDSREFYYKISLPTDHSNSQTGALTIQSNEWYNLVLDVAILGGTSDDLPLEVAGQYYVVDWNTPGFEAGGTLKMGKYLDVARDTFYIYGGDDITIPVTSSHNLSATNTKIDSARFYNPKWTTTTWKWRNLDNRGSVTVDGRTSVKFTNELTNTMGFNLDCYMMKFDLTISNDKASDKKITIIQYPPIYINEKPGGNAMVNGYYGNVNNGNPDQGHYHASAFRSHNGITRYDSLGGNSGTNSGGSYCVETPYAPIARYTSRTDQRDMIVVSISSLASSPSYNINDNGTIRPFNYLLTDPRENADYGANDLERYYIGAWDGNNTTQNTRAWTAEQAAAVKIGSPTGKNYIAPRFMVSSRWGRMGYWAPGNMSDNDRLDLVQHRCATYQEAGYPAGRWRLPTEAEIAFIAQLQRYNFINPLFTDTGYSISSTGGVFTVPANDDPVYNANRGTSCRCVYDLWYWGDDPVEGAQSTYTVMP